MLSYGLASALKQQLIQRQEKNSNYSLRAFARDVQVSPSTMSKIMNEKYTTSDKLLCEIVAYLNLDMLARQKIIFFERCRRLGNFLSTGRKLVAEENTLNFRKSIKVDSLALSDVMNIIETINEGLLHGVEAVSEIRDSELHYNMSIVVEFLPNQ